MRIAVAASLLKSITSESTGGTEAFAHILTEGLVAKGLDVTLFATSDSQTKAKLVSVASSKQTTGVYEGNVETRIPYQLLQIKDMISRSNEFDIIHNNYFHFFLLTSFSPFTDLPIITTMHNHFWQYPNLKNILTQTQRRGKDLVIFASHAARNLAEDLFDAEVIYHGIDVTPFPYSEKSEDYFLFFSRLIPAKGIRDAMDAAKGLDSRLLVAGGKAILPDDVAFIEKYVNPNFSDKVKYVGTPHETERTTLYQNAKALLFPTHLEEQFGLVACEAMACGTPVITYNCGALAEVVEDGVTGFIIDPDDQPRAGKGSWIIKEQGIAGLQEAMKRVSELDRGACRERVMKHFTQQRMIDDYVALYNRILTR